jgi:RNA polymerase sigma factor (sigma-70 family)
MRARSLPEMPQVDPALLDRCVRKDRKAEFELYRVIYGTLMSVARRYERDRQLAQGMVNAAFLKVLDNLDKRRPEVPFEAWCRRITINTVINDHRDRRSYNTPTAMADLEHAQQQPAQDVDGVESMIHAEELQHMLDRLPEMSRKVFNLFAIDGWGHKEIADLLGISEGTSKWHVSNARERLQAMLLEFKVQVKKMATS